MIGKAGAETRVRAVIAPDVLGRSLFEEAPFRVLQLWRDGVFIPVVDSNMLRRYLQILRRLGVLSPDSLRRWSWWLTSADRVEFLHVRGDEHAGLEGPSPSGICLCAALAARARVSSIITDTDANFDAALPDPNEIDRVSSMDFLKRCQDMKEGSSEPS